MTKEDILQALREVHHPGKGDRDIVELGMVHDIEVTDSKVVVTLGFPKRRDPLTEYLVGSARAALIRHLPSSVESEVKAVVVDDDKPKKKGLALGLEQLAEVAGSDRRVSVARELTKIHEENVRGTLEEVIKYFKEKEVKGEIVIILEGKD